jgi:hypothetical protein
MPEGANLGLGSNEELIRELITRFSLQASQTSVDSYINIVRATKLAEMLGSMDSMTKEYRTVDSR